MERTKYQLLVIDDRMPHLDVISKMLSESEFFLTDEEVYTDELLKEIKKHVHKRYDAYLIDVILNNVKEEERKDISDKLSVLLAKKIRAIDTSANILFYTTTAFPIDQDRLQLVIKNSRLITIKYNTVLPIEDGETWTEEEKKIVEFNRKKYSAKVKEILDKWRIYNER